MGLISGAIDRLPPWGRLIVFTLAVLASVFSIAHYGFLHFLLRVIFSPDI
jgi:hypothetical protein